MINLHFFFRLYSVAAILVSTYLFHFARQISKARTDVKEPLIFTICIVSATLISYSFFLLSESYKNALVFYGVFKVCTIWVYFSTFCFNLAYTNSIKKTGIIKTFFFIVCFVESISLLANFRVLHVFNLEPFFSKAGYFYWGIKYTARFDMYWTICTVLGVSIVIALLRSIFKAPSYYKTKYLPILLSEALVFISSYIFNFLNLPLNCSLLILAVAGIFIANCVNKDFNSPVLTGQLLEIIESISDIIFCFDAEENLVYANSVAKNAFKKTDEELAEFARNFKKNYLNERPEKISLTLDDGEPHYYVTEYKIFEISGSKIGSYLRLQDKTKEISDQQRKNYIATHDALTGLLNRSGFFNEMSRALKNSTFTNPLLICTNIKSLKLINTIYGEERGDEVLKNQAEVMKKLGHKKSIIGRMADDKFTIFMEKAGFDKELFEEAFAEISCLTEKTIYPIQITAGIYEIYDKNEKVEKIYDKAKISLDAVKKSDSQIFSYYNSSMMSKMLKEKDIINDFEKSLQEKHFSIQLQPVTDRNGNVLGAESVVRWNHPKYASLKPNSFLKVLERTSLIYKLDVYVWELAAQRLSEWKERGFGDKFISVNISGKDRDFIDIPKTFDSLVKQYDISPENLKIELRETEMVEIPEKNIEIFARLKKMGFKVYIDNFGTGYSSLNVLKDFMVDGIKMDTTFLSESKVSGKNKIILQTMISMSDVLGMEFIAKGVESKNQMTSLSKMNCHLFQGFYFAPPLSVNDFEAKYMRTSLKGSL